MRVRSQAEDLGEPIVSVVPPPQAAPLTRTTRALPPSWRSEVSDSNPLASYTAPLLMQSSCLVSNIFFLFPFTTLWVILKVYYMMIVPEKTTGKSGNLTFRLFFSVCKWKNYFGVQHQPFKVPPKKIPKIHTDSNYQINSRSSWGGERTLNYLTI